MFLDEELENVDMKDEPHFSHAMTEWERTI